MICSPSSALLRRWSPWLAAAGLSLFSIATGADAQQAVKPPTPPDAGKVIPGPPANVPTALPTPQQRSILQQMQDAFTSIARTAEPFVVNIKAAHAVSGTEAAGGLLPEGPTLKTPKNPGSPLGPQTPSPFPRQEQATGSGLIVRSDGYVLTNDHVVEGSPIVTVTLSDGEEFRGRVISDFRSDLAVVKIDPGGAKLTVAKFAESDQVQPGQWAIAIGSPFDLQNTMTVGVISATHRHQAIGEDAVNTRYYPDLLQTDAAINPGNSGGPLVNIDGDVIGVNVAIESPVEGSAGVGFAIPAKTAMYVANELISNGKVVRGYLGLAPQDLTPRRSQEFGVVHGAWVEQVSKDSPAGRAGIRAADVITQFDGRSVDGELDLRTAISTSAPGRSVALELVRDGKPITVSVTVAAPPPSETDVAPSAPSFPKVGVSFRALTASDRQQLSFGPEVSGVLVTAVAPNSPADQAGFQQNDVIERIGRAPVTTSAQVSAALDTVKTGGEITVVILRSDNGKIQEIARDLKI